MPKTFLICVFLILYSFNSALTQISILLKIGLTVPTISFDEISSGGDSKKKLKFGFLIGAGVNVPVNEKFSVQPELLFVQKGEKSEYNSTFYNPQTFMETTVRATDNITINYVEIPVLAQYNFLGSKEENCMFFAEAGPFVGFGLGGKYKTEGANVNKEGDVKFGEPTTTGGTNNNDLYFDNRLDFGLAFGLGGVMAFGSGKLVIDLRYNLGLGNLYDNRQISPGVSYDFKAKTRVIALSLGYFFPLAGSKTQ